MNLVALEFADAAVCEECHSSQTAAKRLFQRRPLFEFPGSGRFARTRRLPLRRSEKLGITVETTSVEIGWPRILTLLAKIDDRQWEPAMIFIVVKFDTKPEWTDRWPDFVASFTEATRAEEGNLWFEWSRSLDKPAEYVLVEAFRDADAGGVHVNSEHFKKAMQELPQALTSTPKIISQMVEATGWSEMGEMSVD